MRHLLVMTPSNKELLQYHFVGKHFEKEIIYYV